MKKVFQIVLTMVLCLAMTGCASGTKFVDAKASIPELKPESGRFYFYRSGSMVGAAMQPDVYLNDKVIGKAVPGGFFFVDMTPGSYQIRTSTEVKRTLSITLDPGQTRYVRFDVSMGFVVGHVSPILIDTQIAEKEIIDCKLANP
jgi:hypothetical protein